MFEGKPSNLWLEETFSHQSVFGSPLMINSAIVNCFGGSIIEELQLETHSTLSISSVQVLGRATSEFKRFSESRDWAAKITFVEP